jgi:hypothetical protein
MTGPPNHQPAEDQTRFAPASGAAPPEWNRAEMERAAEAAPPIVKERLFSPKVLIGWALFTLVMYFGIRVVQRVVKESVHEAVVSSARRSAPGSDGNVVIMLPNGKRITIHTDNPQGPRVTVTQTPPPVKAPGASSR